MHGIDVGIKIEKTMVSLFTIHKNALLFALNI